MRVTTGFCSAGSAGSVSTAPELGLETDDGSSSSPGWATMNATTATASAAMTRPIRWFLVTAAGKYGNRLTRPCNWSAALRHR
jgi:hypothetical protein